MDKEDTQQQKLDGDRIHDLSARPLLPISSNAMSPLKKSTPSTHDNKNGTIWPVASDPLHLDTAPLDDQPRTQTKSDPMPHSNLKQSASIPTIPTHSLPPLTRQNSIPLGNSIVRTISAEFGPTRAFTNGTSPAEDNLSPNGGTAQWSSAVGRANLGKSGRVIERLMAENDSLKRDLKVEALHAEESKQAVKMVEGRMESLVGEYEARLHDAAITKTLLKRRERQLTDLKAQVETEKARANKAAESERGWREATEKLEADSKRKVEEAQTYAALMEGRNKAMRSHWTEQGVEVSRTVGKLGKDIETIVEERRLDDARMTMLQGLCEQQKEQLGKLRTEKEGIGEAFERYKVAQDGLLQDIKNKASEQEQKNQKILDESQKVLGELKWALGVNKNVRGAQ
jgi:hypothetical protein